MTETALDSPLKVSATFERSVGLPGYNNSIKARAWAEGDLPAGSDGSDVIAAQKRLFEALKIEVLTQLGIEFEFDSNGVVVEKVHAEAAQTLTVQEAKSKLENAFAPSNVVPIGAPIPEGVVRSAVDFDWGKVPADVVAAFHANPDAFYDNRASKTPGSNGPDLKRKSDGKGFWIVSKF